MYLNMSDEECNNVTLQQHSKLPMIILDLLTQIDSDDFSKPSDGDIWSDPEGWREGGNSDSARANTEDPDQTFFISYVSQR